MSQGVAVAAATAAAGEMEVLQDYEIQMLYAWIDEIPLSRPKKNLTRDFSDGVCCAEVVHHFIPKLVELHNYSPANALTQKVYNWNTLNQKVFRKFGYSISDSLIHHIVNNKPGYVEYVLFELKKKISEVLSNPNFLASLTKGSQKQPYYPTAQPPLKYGTHPTMIKGAPTLPGKPTATLPHHRMYDYVEGEGQEASPSPYAFQPHMTHQQHPVQNHQGSYGYQQTMGPPNTYGFPTQTTTYAQTLQLSSNGPTGIYENPNATLPSAAMENPYSSPYAYPPASSTLDPKDRVISEMKDTIQNLRLKITKLEKIIVLKDQQIESLVNTTTNSENNIP